MIIEFNKSNNYYDKLSNLLYNNNTNNVIYNNFIPIIINNEHFILTSSKNIEGYLIEYNINAHVKLYIKNKKSIIECMEIKINGVSILGHDDINPDANCFIDTINNLFFLKVNFNFKMFELKFIKIKQTTNYIDELKYDKEKIQLNFNWTDHNFIKHNLKSNDITNIWINTCVNFPPIPYIINIVEGNDKPITGSAVYDVDNNFLGMVSYINKNEIFITPLICIKKIYDYLNNEKILYLALDFLPIKFDLKNPKNIIDYQYGLMIMNKHYDNNINVVNKLKKKIKKQNENVSNDNNVKQNNKLQDLLNEQKEFEIHNCDKILRNKIIICDIDNYKIDIDEMLIINEKKINMDII